MLAPPRVLFSGLVDDAGLFPPRSAAVPSAVADHLTWRSTPVRDLIGTFVCPASGVEQMCTALPIDEHLQVSLVADTDAEALREALDVIIGDPRLLLVAVEAAHARLGDDADAVGQMLASLQGVAGVLEVEPANLERSLALVTHGSWQLAKYRTGGASADAFPTEAELAEFVVACVVRGVGFKLTAGLHHVVRNFDKRTEFQQHGVLNVLLAVAAALADEPTDVVATILAQRDAEVVRTGFKHWDDDICVNVRAAFRSFGCCDPAQPITELRKLGLLTEWP